MTNQNFVNQKLKFVEEIVLHTDAHIFLTGKAGTGKTTFLRSLPMKTAKRMAVVAPTGVAAINAGGQTIHSFFQLPFGPQIPEDARPSVGRDEWKSQTLASQFQKIRKPKLQLMRALDLLIIDEISMVRADVLDAVDAVLRRARRSTRPFGGVQLLMIGDKQTKLTTKENELLALLCSHSNEILQRDFALKTIWIDDNYFNARSMDVYITKLRKHLKADEQIEIINIHGKGYKLITPEEE